eukprot:12928417-Prorocentrum_lima.AAC.1
MVTKVQKEWDKAHSEQCGAPPTYWTKPDPQLTQHDHLFSRPYPATPGRCASCNYHVAHAYLEVIDPDTDTDSDNVEINED